MKKTIKILLSVVLSVLMTASALACGGVDLDKENKDGTDVEISTPQYGFIEREEFTPDAEDPLAGTQEEKGFKFEVGTTYYLIITFTLTPRSENDGQSYFKTTAKFDNLDILNASMQQASTSSTSVEVEHNMLEDTYSRNVQATFKIPASPEDVKKYTMIVRMVPNKASGDEGVQVKIAFDLDGDYRIWGADGFTRQIDIIKGTLAKPEVAYDDSEWSLNWQHVKNASYYVVYDENDNPITFETNGVKSEKIEVTPDIKVGANMKKMLENAYKGDALLSGYNSLKVKAFGKNGVNDESFYSSEYSEPVTMTLVRG